MERFVQRTGGRASDTRTEAINQERIARIRAEKGGLMVVRTAHYWTHAATPGRPLRALDHATPERHLIREMKSRKNKMFLPRLDPQGSVPCRLYPAIRDHQSVLVVQEWLVAVEGLNRATKLVKEKLPDGTELRLLMTELLGFTKRSRHRVGLAVAEVTDQT